MEGVFLLKPVPQVRKEQYYRYLVPFLFIILDYVAILLAEEIAFGLRGVLDLLQHGDYAIAASYVYFWIPFLFILFLGNSRAYNRMQPILSTIRDVFYSVNYGLITCIILLYFLQATFLASRLYIVLFGVLVLFNIYILRYGMRKIMKVYRLFPEPIIVVGAKKTAEMVLKYFDGDLGYRYELVGIIDDQPSLEMAKKSCLMVAPLDQAEEIIRKSRVQTVIIAAPELSKAKLQTIISKIQPHVRNLSFIPDLVGTPMGSVEVSILFSEKTMMLKIKNNLARRRNRIFKRTFDLVCTILGAAAISPILLILVILVGIDNKGHIIFSHRRVGKHGKLFPCYKFQTMVPNAQEKLKIYLEKNANARKEWEESFKLTNDPRVTKLGAFLRRTSLDELPQLWNVIKGDMSLVGPRPIVTDELEKYGDNIKEYYMVTPGITGMWQVSGRSDTTYEERVSMDTWYVRNWSIWIDLMYLFKTVKAVICGRGAY